MRRDELGKRMEFDDDDDGDDVARRMIMRGGAASLNAWVVLPTPPPSDNIAEKDARRSNGVFLLIMAGSMFMVCLVYENAIVEASRSRAWIHILLQPFIKSIVGGE